MATVRRVTKLLCLIIPIICNFYVTFVSCESQNRDGHDQVLRGNVESIPVQHKPFDDTAPGPGNIRKLRPDSYRQQAPVGGYQPLPKVKAHIHTEWDAKTARNKAPLRISDQPQCLKDIEIHCTGGAAVRKNNFAILDCLQNSNKEEDSEAEELSEECQHLLWNFKRNMTRDLKFDNAASEVCRSVMTKLPECVGLPSGQGEVISCLIDHKANITDQNCKLFLTKMEKIVFSDYRLISKFTDACQSNIEELKCGRLATDKSGAPHTQGMTVECLSHHVSVLTETCKRQILRVAELQADDYHLDRPLFYACRDDRERFCADINAGAGRVYQCLYRHKFARDMTIACRAKLVLRQQLMREDYKVNKMLMSACRADIRQQHCLRGKHVPDSHFAKLSHVLLCLDGAIREGHQVAPECIGELKEMRRSLMEDYKVSPEVVRACAAEISGPCNDKTMLREGRVLHCLMDLARPRNNKYHNTPAISSRCRRELEEVMEEADVGENYEMDPLLAEACQEVVEVACKHVKPGEARVISCLLEKIDTDDMSDECEERLMETQYFIARSFKLDPRLFKACKKDAASRCNAAEKWYDPDSTNPSQGPLVFACLYRTMKQYKIDKKVQLSRACSFQVRRVMHQRAVSIELEPRIEEPCLIDLATFCSDDTAKGEETQCLQDHYDELRDECREVIGNFTEDESEDIELDKIIMKACSPMIKLFCKSLIDNEEAEPGEVMLCLIKHKHHADMNHKCSAGIMHHQLMALKDFRFSYRFKEACKTDVMHLCMPIKKKVQMVQCLSEHIRNDTLLEDDHRVSHDCRKQLRFELLQQSENIQLDPVLKEKCEIDVVKFCPHVTKGNAAVIECLKKYRHTLSKPCHLQLFKREREQAKDITIDYLVNSACKGMMKMFCKDSDPEDLFECLKEHKNELNFDSKCSDVITKRQQTRTLDVRLNPKLMKSCKLEIGKFCRREMTMLPNAQPGQNVEGQVIQCLKKQFVKPDLLTSGCQMYLGELIGEASVNYHLDPILSLVCKTEIKKLCTEARDKDARGANSNVGECLKRQLQKGRITDDRCRKEVARTLQEDRADIHVDVLLNRACSQDLQTYCSDVPHGVGQQMSCLLAVLDDKAKLHANCQRMLQERVDMWSYAIKVAPVENIGELMAQVTQSTSRNYFLTILFLIIGSIFIGGLFCGRATKRVLALSKNK